MREFVRHVHFVGVGGAGMSGIASVLIDQGYVISGSDQIESETTRSLMLKGAQIFIGHDAANAKGADVVVVSNAVRGDNVEVLRAKEAGIPVVPRAQMLGELMRFRNGIAVGGTHGKTTTTSLIAAVFSQAGLDPTFLVGGLVKSEAGNARLGNGQWLIAEADESDASFLHLQPHIAVVTNIDSDHMATYEGDFEKLKETFLRFIHNLPFYGLAILCTDDPVIERLRSHVLRPVVSYGLEKSADYRAVNVRSVGSHMHFDVTAAGANGFSVELALPGLHNVQNALAAIAVADKVGISPSAIQQGLAAFGGIGRRFEMLGDIRFPKGRALLVDDYAHHPREIEATLAAAEGCWPDRRKVVVFQPHRFSRTRDLMDDFSALLSQVNCLVVAEVYAAGEKPLATADGRSLCRAIRARGGTDPIFVPRIDRLQETLLPLLQDNDVVLTLGAGDIGRVSREMVSPVRLHEGTFG
ncbi:MAG: UDP-N-acetylmuramate--L-alanine ligase [Gammaproteobacteria bacterium]|nr:UDP-N-acetylmuramate--L-alanine ligase [Gammaproteobacteria bacterium]NDA13656.1 UDP-N-acetylmuramate--L-alanine ligase [Gammaproteobacteria bacterium]NDG43183.1 UDP-N-acetylmuramate--L-alanine ligase [Gammaproteobacteria bacterium]